MFMPSARWVEFCAYKTECFYAVQLQSSILGPAKNRSLIVLDAAQAVPVMSFHGDAYITLYNC